MIATHDPKSWLVLIKLASFINFLSLIVNKEKNEINLDWEDEIVNAVVLTENGSLRLEQFK